MGRQTVARTAVAALLVVAGGCGGGSKDPRDTLKDARPCLSRLGLVTGGELPPGVERPEHVDGSSLNVAFRAPGRGANGAGVSVFRTADLAKKARRDALAAGLSQRPDRLLDTVYATWSSPPTAKQRRQIRACFD